MVKPTIPAQDMVPLAELLNHPLNYRVHPQTQVERVAKSIKLYGQRKAVPVRKDENGLVIIAGHCVVKALWLLSRENLSKWGHCWVSYVPEDWTEEQTIGYLIADNKTSDGAEDDQHMLYELVEQSQKSGYKLDQLGFTQQMYEQLTTEINKKPKEEELPEVEFAQELLESQNFLVLTFSNEIDWNYLQTLYPLPRVRSAGSKPGYDHIGTGRVVDGVDFINKIRDRWQGDEG